VTVHGNDHGNGEALTTNQKGILKNYGEVWYHEDATTNILSLKNVRSKFKLTYVSHPKSVFTVHKPDGSINEFRMYQDGLHYFDTKSRSSVSITPVSAEVQSSNQQLSQSKQAIELQVKLSHPSLHHLKAIVSVNPIPSIPISIADIDRNEKVPVSSLPISMGQLPIPSQSDCIHASDFILAELPCALVPKSKVPSLASISDRSKFTVVEPFISRAMSLIPDAHHNLMWLNAFPFRNGVSLSMYPRSFISGVPLEFKLHFQLVFGSHGPVKPSSLIPPFTGNRCKAAAPLLLQSELHHASTVTIQDVTQMEPPDATEPLHHLPLLSVRHRSAPEPHPFHCDAHVKAPLVVELNVAALIPSPVLEPITLAAVIDAAEGHEVVIVDLPNAFVQANLPESPSKRTKRLIRRYLFVSGNVLKGSKCIEYSPTIDMLAIPFTKPLQGKLFVKFRKAIRHLPDQ